MTMLLYYCWSVFAAMGLLWLVAVMLFFYTIIVTR